MAFCMKQKRYCILIISLIWSTFVPAQTVDDVVRLADTQFGQGNFANAAKEYNRAFFFGYNKQDELSLQIARCYTQLNQLELASDFYNKAYRLSGSDSIKDEALLGEAFGLLIQEKYVLAISELLNLSENASTQQKIQYHFLKGIAHYGIRDDSIAYTEFVQSLQLSGALTLNGEILKTEFDKVFRYQKRYNPKRAYVMSGIVPGSGQLYTGAIKNGINSMLLIGGLYLIAINVARNYSFWDAAVALFPWVQRYYLGGMDKSKELAISKIESKRYESYLKIIELTAPNDYK